MVQHTVSNAQSALIHLVGVQDCGVHGTVLGGVTMKLMDEVRNLLMIPKNDFPQLIYCLLVFNLVDRFAFVSNYLPSLFSPPLDIKVDFNFS